MARVLLKNAAGEQISVDDRQLLVLCGRNGDGHVQTLRALSGLQELGPWEFLIGGRSPESRPGVEREGALILDATACFSHLTVRENLAFPLKHGLRKVPKTELLRRVEEAGKLLGLSQDLEELCAGLSLPKRLRVVIGRALVCQPKVLFFQHPFENLKSSERLELRIELAKLRLRLPAPIIWASNDPQEAMVIGDRIALFKEGHIAQVSTPADIYREPVDVFAARFFGQPPINLVRGKFKETSGGILFKENGEGSMECKLPALAAAIPFLGKEVILGIRPEDIGLVKEASRPEGCRFQAVVDLVEFNGANTDFYLHTGAHQVVCRAQAEADHGEEGRRLRFEFDPARVYLFDPTTTKRLS